MTWTLLIGALGLGASAFRSPCDSIPSISGPSAAAAVPSPRRSTVTAPAPSPMRSTATVPSARRSTATAPAPSPTRSTAAAPVPAPTWRLRAAGAPEPSFHPGFTVGGRPGLPLTLASGATEGVGAIGDAGSSLQASHVTAAEAAQAWRRIARSLPFTAPPPGRRDSAGLRDAPIASATDGCVSTLMGRILPPSPRRPGGRRGSGRGSRPGSPRCLPRVRRPGYDVSARKVRWPCTRPPAPQWPPPDA